MIASAARYARTTACSERSAAETFSDQPDYRICKSARRPKSPRDSSIVGVVKSLLFTFDQVCRTNHVNATGPRSLRFE